MKRFYWIFLVIYLLNINQLYSSKFSYKGDCVYHPGFSPSIDFLEECLDKELNDYDKELNILYKKLYNTSSKDKLKKSEIAWIKFKESDCRYMASEVLGGKEYSNIYNACLINRTMERIADLNRSHSFFDWFRGRVDLLVKK